MTLHVFNPEHDIALGLNLSNFTPPEAARRLASALSFLPALWASGGDAILVDNVQEAWKRYAMLSESTAAHRPRPLFVTAPEVKRLPISTVEPWGWDRAIVSRLLRLGVSGDVLPSGESLKTIRTLSSRQFAATILPHLRLPGTVGEATACHDEHAVFSLLSSTGQAVLKAPWSSSGRGVRFVSGKDTPMSVGGWVRNVIARQGAVMVEPLYRKILDCGMEFHSDGNGNIRYLGLSVFKTDGSGYTGNMLAGEDEKSRLIGQYIPGQILSAVRQRAMSLLSSAFRHKYAGPFGIDMMVARQDGSAAAALHPCVEINLRRTMGHAALALAAHCGPAPCHMEIDAKDNCKIKITHT